MEKELLRKVQLGQLEIAKEIKRVCDENNIEYWLDSGSLLGAIRHKGFIPWDDDMDIGMKREAYEEFLKIAPVKLKPEFYLQQWETDKGYAFSFAKVRKNGTVYVENYSKKSNTHNGLYVDVFPYDHYREDSEQGLVLKILKAIIKVKCGVETWKHGERTDFFTLLKNVPSMIIAPFCKKTSLVKKYYEIATRHNNETCEYYFPQGISNYGKWLIPISAMQEMIEIEFEDALFKVPKGYDEYLKHAYGEYMVLPPENQRENRHQIKEIKL